VWDASRTAIDLDLDAPVLLRVVVSVHHCPCCRHHFRAQPPFLRPDAIYTNRIVAKALQAVYEDGLAFRRAPDRLARDFWVRPSEGAIRVWCRAYSSQLADQESYLPWVVEEFSGLLCVDEVYQGQLALLLAVDPASPSGDRLVGYQLVTGTVDRHAVDAFLTRLKEAGISPEEVITDGSSLYPSLLAEIWPAAAHQLCLFHETRHVTTAVAKVLTQVRRSLPTPPPRPRQGRGGPLSPVPPTRHRDDPATQQWHLRRARRHAELTEVHDLARQGYSQQAIARQTGRNRRTIRRWLAQEIPELSEETQEVAARAAVEGEESTLRRRRWTAERQARLEELARQGLSHSAIARITGLHRVTVGRWLNNEPLAEAPDQEGDETRMPTEERVPLPATEQLASEESPAQDARVVPPPAPWTSWTQVREVREALKEHRGLFLRRPDHLSPEQQDTIDALMAGPAGDPVEVVRHFLVDWYALWRTAEGDRRSWEEAQERYERWRTDPAYQAVPALRQVQDRMTPARFARLSQFLRHAHFEATNNGAERAGRAFRHGQAPHFRLRTEVAIDGALRVVMAQTKERASVPPVPLPRLCSRGRCSRSASEVAQAA
jgi:transposase